MYTNDVLLEPKLINENFIVYCYYYLSELAGIQCNEELKIPNLRNETSRTSTNVFLQKAFHIYDKIQSIVEVYSEVRTFMSKLFQ